MDRANAPGKANLVFKTSENTLTAAQVDRAVEVTNAWAWFTDLSFSKTGDNYPAWDIYFTRGFDADTGLAGWMEPIMGDSGCRYVGARVYFNTNHTRQTLDDHQCAWVHEVGHGIGLAHSNIAGHNDGPGAAHPRAETVMRGSEHGIRCHVADPPVWPGSADIADANWKY